MSREVLVTGSSGLVGSRFVESSNKSDLYTPSASELNITSIPNIKEYIKNKKLKVVVNFASFTNVDGAEKERGNIDGDAWQLNVEGVRKLSDICKEKDIFLIQVSTDFVFKGDEDNRGPYSESSVLPDNMKGISWYGWTKNRAEKLISESGCRYAIVRIAYPFYSNIYDKKTDFAKGFINLFDEKKLYPIFNDQTLSILNVNDLNSPLKNIINKEIGGIFHVVSRDTTTSFEFVSYLLEKSRNVKNVVREGSMKDFLSKEGRTPRPRLGGLKTKFTEKKLNMKFKTWKQMVDDFVSNS